MSSQVAKQGGLLAVDCVVICCCCPCLVLQVTIFLFIRLPCKLAVKSKRIILKKLHKISRRRRKHRRLINVRRNVDNGCGYWMEFDDDDPPDQGSNNSLRPDQMLGFPDVRRRSRRILLLESEHGNGSVEMGAWIAQDMQFVFDRRNALLIGDDDEAIWKEMLEKGVFFFGSFWANGDYSENNYQEFIETSQCRRRGDGDYHHHEIEICSPRF